MSLLSISLSALNAAQAGLTTTTHNISNASTDGYNRQRIMQSTQDPLYTGSGFFGQGTRVDNVQRVYSQFLTAQTLTSDTARAEFQVYGTEINQIDTMLADATSGLSPAMQDFFKGMQELSTNPASIPSRQSLLSTSTTLVDRFHSMSDRLSEIRTGLNAQLTASTQTISSLASQVAELNNRIRTAEVAGAGVPANDLHDLRDKLISQINQEVRVSTVTQSDGSINLFFGSGQPLVLGNTSYTLSTGQSPNNPEELAIYTSVGSGNMLVPDSLITGGTLGGLLRFRNEALDPATNELGRIAITIAENVNAQHALGQDLDGKLGGAYFNTMAPDIKQISGTGTVTATPSFLQVQDLKDEDYTLRYTTAGGYSLSRNSDGTVVYSGATPPDGTTTDPTNTDKTIRYGFQVAMSAAPTNGDTWLIQPTRKAAQNIALAIQDARKIAAAAPFSLNAETGNSGTATIGNGTAVATTGFDTAPVDGVPDFSAITLTYNATSKTFSAVNAAGVAVTLNVRSGGNPLDPPDIGTPSGSLSANNSYDPAINSAGKTFEIGSPALSFTISGNPSNGDVFRITTNTQGTTDNRNAIQLVQMQNVKTMLNGGASYEYAYSQTVSNVGTKARDASVGESAQTALHDQAVAAQQSLSGVNLDEEAANLLRYQQAYQAAARVMNVSNTLFDEILSVARG